MNSNQESTTEENIDNLFERLFGQNRTLVFDMENIEIIEKIKDEVPEDLKTGQR